MMVQKFQAICTGFDLIKTSRGGTIRVKLNTGHFWYVGHKSVVQNLIDVLNEIGFPGFAGESTEEILDIACKFMVPLNFEYKLEQVEDDSVYWAVRLAKLT